MVPVEDPETGEEFEIQDETPMLSIKFIADGCKTLREVAAALRDAADEMDKASKDGWELAAPIDQGNSYLERRASS
jgi:hypothetical protein